MITPDIWEESYYFRGIDFSVFNPLLHEIYFHRLQRDCLRKAPIVYRLIDMALVGIFLLSQFYMHWITSVFFINIIDK